MEKNLKILLIDDDKNFLLETLETLRFLGYSTMLAETAGEAKQLIKAEKIDLVFLDIILPDKNGLDFLQEIKTDFPETEVIIMTAEGNKENVLLALRKGAADFLEKPLLPESIRNSIMRTKIFSEKMGKIKQLELKYDALSKLLDEKFGYKIVGKSKTVMNLLTRIRKLAMTDSTSVLIQGERGTGKELVARAIHCSSSRKNNIFYPINCSSIADNLFESEFFGHKKGAFTGAFEDKAGCFETANHGTLFLDEIGDMSLNLQAKLLRVLEDKKIRKIGSHQEIEVDVRIIAATNHDIKKQVKEGKFRADLFDRLNRFNFIIPPLRKRKEDIPILTEYFIGFFAKNMKRKIQPLSSEIKEKLLDYPFPGNVRELKNMIEHALILSENGYLYLQHFPTLLEKEENFEEQDLNLDKNEKQLILKALERTAGHKGRAAKLLGIKNDAMTRRLKKYKISLTAK